MDNNIRITYNADFVAFGTNLKPENFEDDNRYPAELWEKSLVKLYPVLSVDIVRTYHKIHNIFYERLNGQKIHLKVPFNLDWQTFEVVTIEVLKLKDIFVSYEKLLKKLKKWLLEKILKEGQKKFGLENKELIDLNKVTISIQDFVKWKNIWREVKLLKTDIQKKLEFIYSCINSSFGDVSNPQDLLMNTKKDINLLNNKLLDVDLFALEVSNFLHQKFPYLTKKVTSQIHYNNLYYYVKDNKLVVCVSDFWSDVGFLVSNLGNNLLSNSN